MKLNDAMMKKIEVGTTPQVGKAMKQVVARTLVMHVVPGTIALV